jgi:hypothetical protein
MAGAARSWPNASTPLIPGNWMSIKTIWMSLAGQPHTFLAVSVSMVWYSFT